MTIVYGEPPAIAYYADPVVVELLLDLGADIDAKTPAGETPCQLWENFQMPMPGVGDQLCGR